MRSLAQRAGTEGVDVKYVEQMRRALYAAADEVDRLAAALERINEKRSDEESREATHEWIKEFVGDYAYAHDLADDVWDMLDFAREALNPGDGDA